MKKKVSDLSEESHQQTQQLHSTRHENTRLRQKVSELTDMIKEIQSTCDEKDAELREVCKEKKELRQQVADLKKRIRSYQSNDTREQNSIVTDILALIDRHGKIILAGIGLGIISIFLIRHWGIAS